MKNIFLLILYGLLASAAIKMTPASQALLHDATAYYNSATTGLIDSFIDQGYPFFLKVVMAMFGQTDIVIFQLANYLLWIGSSYLIYRALVSKGVKNAQFASLIMLFSPLFLSFSAKLYSEPFAAFGVSLLIFGTVTYSWLGLIIGVVILGSTKSIFIPGIFLLALYYLGRQKYKVFIPLLAGVLILIPVFINSLGGGRSLYNLAVERAKLDQSYDQILACTPYYLSYPLGLKLLPQYQGVCHQNDPSPTMTGYEHNPYIRAEEIRNNGFTYADWWQSIINNPVKYLLVFIVGLFNLVLFEGVYPSILLQLPQWLIPIIFVVTKLVLVSYLWIRVLLIGRSNWRYLLPIIYLFVMIGNFQVEPRYIYPLIPYIYFLVGLDHNKNKI